MKGKIGMPNVKEDGAVGRCGYKTLIRLVDVEIYQMQLYLTTP